MPVLKLGYWEQNSKAPVFKPQLDNYQKLVVRRDLAVYLAIKALDHVEWSTGDFDPSKGIVTVLTSIVLTESYINTSQTVSSGVYPRGCSPSNASLLGREPTSEHHPLATSAPSAVLQWR